MSEWILPAGLGWEVEGVLYRSHPEANNAVNRIKKATGKRPPMRPPRELPEGWVIVGVGAWAGWPIPRALLDATGNVLTGLQPYVDRGGLLPELASAPASAAPGVTASASPASAAPGVTASASPASAAPGVTASASPASAADAERMTAVLDLRRREVEAAERQAAAFERIAGLLEARLQAPAVSEAAAAAPEVSSSHAEGPDGSAS